MPRPDFPKSITQFHDWFPDEEACAEYLFNSRWPNGFVCPRCGHDEYWETKEWGRFQCTKCKHQTSLTAGTVMHSSKLPLRTWFYGAFLMTTHTPGMSALQFQRQLDLSRYETAYQMFQKIRAGLVNPDRSNLIGTVEADETYIGGAQAGPGGRGARGKAIVIGAVEVRGRASGRLRLREIPDVTARSPLGFIKDTMEPSTIVATDGWGAYSGLTRIGYNHEIREERPNKKGAPLPHIHRVFGLLKTWLLGTHHGVDPKHLQAYLNEYVFRFNRRMTPMAAFQTALGIGSMVWGPTYEEIYTAGKEGGWKHLGEPD